MHPLTVNMELRLASAALGPPEAWFLPGEPAEWLTVLLEQCGTAGGLRFYVVGHPDEQTTGVVVCGVDGSPGWNALPYVRVADRILVPAASRFFPDVAEDEIRELLNADSIKEFVWHPTSGLIGYEASQILQVSDLLEVSRAASADWDCADAGSFVNSRLVSVLPSDQLTPEMILALGRDDIGSDADDIGSIPRSPDEPSSGAMKDLMSRMLSPFARTAKWLASQAPQGMSTPAWLDAVQQRAGDLLRRVGISQSRRLNELRRLMSMLESDPDRGLRYALPFGGGASRGLAPPSNVLASHATEYSGWGHGGGPADYWEVPAQIQAALIAKYRELAQREAALGRYSRAAYIYAALLNDYPAAAQVLIDGGYYREAAEIYRGRLKQARKAAECLVKGGLWPEAVEIYEELKDWKTVAEIYENLEEHEAARDAWQKAADDSAIAGNHLGAAAIQEKHLHNEQAAAEHLIFGWNHSGSGKDCLTALFGLFGRFENHTASADWIQKLAKDNDLSIRQQNDVADIFVGLSHRYPDADIRTEAFDSCRRIVARRLADHDQPSRHRFLSVLEKLIPSDRLFRRDCRRYEDQRTTKPTRPETEIVFLDRIQLRNDVIWQTAVRSSARIFAAGYQQDSLVVASWTDTAHPAVQYSGFYVRRERQEPILLAPVPGLPDAVYLHVVGMNEQEIGDFGLDRSGTGIRPLPFFDEFVSAFGAGRNGTVWTLGVGDDGFEMRGNFERGSPVTRRSLPISSSSFHPTAFIQPFDGRKTVCAVDQTLIVTDGMQTSGNSRQRHPDRYVIDTTASSMESESGSGAGLDQFSLPHPVRRFCFFEDTYHPCCAMLFGDGGLVHWIHSSNQQSFADGLTGAMATFLSNGDLIAVDEHGQIEIYRTREEELKLVARHSASGDRPVAVLPALSRSGMPCSFFVCRSDGSVDVFGSYC